MNISMELLFILPFSLFFNMQWISGMLFTYVSTKLLSHPELLTTKFTYILLYTNSLWIRLPTLPVSGFLWQICLIVLIFFRFYFVNHQALFYLYILRGLWFFVFHRCFILKSSSAIKFSWTFSIFYVWFKFLCLLNFFFFSLGLWLFCIKLIFWSLLQFIFVYLFNELLVQS